MTRLGRVERWACDRCLVVEQVGEVRQPENWHRLVMVTPPKKVLDEPEVNIDLCGPCSQYMMESITIFPESRLVRKLG